MKTCREGITKWWHSTSLCILPNFSSSSSSSDLLLRWEEEQDGGANSTAGLQKSSRHPRQEEAQTLSTHLFAFIYNVRNIYQRRPGSRRSRTRIRFTTPGRGKAVRRDAWIISPLFSPSLAAADSAQLPVHLPASLSRLHPCQAQLLGSGAAAAPAPAGTAAAERGRGGPCWRTRLVLEDFTGYL